MSEANSSILALKPRDLQAMNMFDHGYIYLVMVANGWGKNSNAAEAYRIAKRSAGLTGSRTFFLYRVPQDAYVSDHGSILWKDPKADGYKVGEYREPKWEKVTK